MKTEPIFVDKLCAEITFSGKYVVKLKPETKRCVKICFAWQSELCRKTLCWVFKFWKYYAAHNSGLKIWLVSGKSEIAQLFNLKFWLYLWRLGVGFCHIFKPQNVKCNIFSELTQNASLLFFRLIIFKKLAENFCVITEFWTELCRKTLCWKYVAWNQSLREKPSLRENGKLKTNFAFKRCIVYQVPKI